MRRVLVVGALSMVAVGCSGGSDEPSNQITRIDGPAVVDEDLGGADNGATDDSSDG